jgi:hypothetical protein
LAGALAFGFGSNGQVSVKIGFQLLEEILHLCIGETGASIADVAQLALVIHSQHQNSQMFPPSLPYSNAAYHSLLVHSGLNLDPAI